MTRILLLPALLGALALVGGCSKTDAAAAADHPAGELIVASTASPEWLEAAVTAYPLAYCPVSGDSLGADMGFPQDYVWRVAGQPDRLVRFCCQDCLAEFEANPAKFLAMIDEAAMPEAMLMESGHDHETDH